MQIPSTLAIEYKSKDHWTFPLIYEVNQTDFTHKPVDVYVHVPIPIQYPITPLVQRMKHDGQLYFASLHFQQTPFQFRITNFITVKQQYPSLLLQEEREAFHTLEEDLLQTTLNYCLEKKAFPSTTIIHVLVPLSEPTLITFFAEQGFELYEQKLTRVYMKRTAK